MRACFPASTEASAVTRGLVVVGSLSCLYRWQRCPSYTSFINDCEGFHLTCVTRSFLTPDGLFLQSVYSQLICTTVCLFCLGNINLWKDTLNACADRRKDTAWRHRLYTLMHSNVRQWKFSHKVAQKSQDLIT